MADVIDLIKYTADNNPVDFGSTFKELLGQKALDLLNTKKQEVAASMFGNEPDTDDDQELEDTLDDIDTDLDDEPELSADETETGEEDEDN